MSKAIYMRVHSIEYEGCGEYWVSIHGGPAVLLELDDKNEILNLSEMYQRWSKRKDVPKDILDEIKKTINYEN